MWLSDARHDCPTAAPLRRLDSIGQIDSAVEQSRNAPVLIFKHSITCGLSAQAYDELLNALRESSPPIAYVVCVQTDRAVSSAVAQRFGIRHESPQLLVLARGRVCWSASHFRVSAPAIRRAMSQLSRLD
ncbi:MAG: bacillithiol system redox-active protein YtxJ [Vicinamibacterales bacterium]